MFSLLRKCKNKKDSFSRHLLFIKKKHEPKENYKTTQAKKY